MLTHNKWYYTIEHLSAELICSVSVNTKDRKGNFEMIRRIHRPQFVSSFAGTTVILFLLYKVTGIHCVQFKHFDKLSN